MVRPLWGCFLLQDGSFLEPCRCPKAPTLLVLYLPLALTSLLNDIWATKQWTVGSGNWQAGGPSAPVMSLGALVTLPLGFAVPWAVFIPCRHVAGERQLLCFQKPGD